MVKKGRKTRLIDNAIQSFFKNGFCWIFDGRNNDSNKHQSLLDKFVARLHLEHKGQGYTYKYGKYDGISCFKVEKHDL